MAEPPFLRFADDLPEIEGRYPAPFEAEGLSFGRDLGRAAGSARLGAWRERLPPGRRTSRLHAHSLEEEAVYVLTGQPVLCWQEPGGPVQRTPLRPGAYLSLRAGTQIAHTIENPGPDEAVLLVIGERHPGDRVAYPNDPDLEAFRAEHRPARLWRDEGALPWPAWIDTPRLRLRPWLPIESQRLRALAARNQSHLLPWMPWAEQIPSLEGYLGLITTWARDHLNQTDLTFGMFTHAGDPIGNIGLYRRLGPGALEVGFWIDQDHSGQGYVTEAAAALCQVGLRAMKLDRIELRCLPENQRSAAVARRLGFVHEATLDRRVVGLGGALLPAMIWSLYRESLDHSPAAAVHVSAYDPLGRRLL